MTSTVPQWFSSAIAQPPEHLAFEHEGLRLHYRAWGGRGQRVVVLLHGGSAHGGWWEHIAPYLATGHRVLAPDLTGHGRSDHRDHYGLDIWAGEVAALLAVESRAADEPPFVIGHSMGGWVTMMLAAQYPDLPGGIIVVDVPMRHRSPEERAAQARNARTSLPVYDSLETALGHFRLMPDQDSALPYVMAHVGRASVKEVEGGWTWMFDPQVFARSRDVQPDFRAVSCPTTLLASEKGLLSLEMAGRGAEMLGGPVVVAQIPNAGHHAMMDQPLSLVTALRLSLAYGEA
ncbi:MAG: alpha/beta fold hydrolase [Mycobacteriales bacterium]